MYLFCLPPLSWLLSIVATKFCSSKLFLSTVRLLPSGPLTVTDFRLAPDTMTVVSDVSSGTSKSHVTSPCVSAVFVMILPFPPNMKRLKMFMNARATAALPS